MEPDNDAQIRCLLNANFEMAPMTKVQQCGGGTECVDDPFSDVASCEER